MKPRSRFLELIVTGIVLFGAVLGTSQTALAQRPRPAKEPAAQDGIEVLTRGPVHEAFAEPVVFDPAAGMIVHQPPPEAIEETPPDQKPAGENVVWIAGYWGWDEERNQHIWVSGIWRAVPPGMVWVPGHWAEERGGWQWVSGFWRRGEDDEVTYLPAPPESLEAGPVGDAPTRDHVWVSGTWVWRGTRYAWRPGHYVHFHRGWTWVPAHYVWCPRGYIFVDGYWDFEIARRGALFAPVYFHEGYYSPDYLYSPSVVIDLNIFTNHLFARPHYRHYYFGDYYAADYFSIGIYPWFSFHMSRYGYDPIFAYASWHYSQSDSRWGDRLRDEFRFRREHEEARPPRTYGETRALSERRSDPNTKHLVLATSFDAMASRGDSSMKFERLPDERRKEMTKETKEFRDLRDQRLQLEAKTPSANPARPDQVQPQQAKLVKSPLAARAARTRGDDATPPAKPTAPKDEPVASPKTKEKATQRPEPKLDPPEPAKPKAGERPKEAKPEKPREAPKPSQRPPQPDKPKDEAKPPKAEPKPEKPRDEPRPPKHEPKPDRPHAEPKLDAPKADPKPEKPPKAESRREKQRDDAKPPKPDSKSDRVHDEPRPEKRPDEAKPPKVQSKDPGGKEPNSRDRGQKDRDKDRKDKDG